MIQVVHEAIRSNGGNRRRRQNKGSVYASGVTNGKPGHKVFENEKDMGICGCA